MNLRRMCNLLGNKTRKGNKRDYKLRRKTLKCLYSQMTRSSYVNSMEESTKNLPEPIISDYSKIMIQGYIQSQIDVLYTINKQEESEMKTVPFPSAPQK